MDIKTVIENCFNNKGLITQEKIQKKMSKDTYKPTTSNNVFANKILDWQKEAVLAIKRDPAVLEAKVSIKGQDSFSSRKTSQVSNKPKESKPAQEHTPELKLRVDFESKMRMERAALLSLSSAQFSLILKYVHTLRQQRVSMQKQIECGFCKNNKQPEVWYNTHVLKDRQGRVRCPVLRSFVCPQCGATGDHAHTITHCPN